MKDRVAAIIPAFNEEDHIANVIRALRAVPEVHEILVVNDGSWDRTAEVARAHGATVLDLPENLGKGAAMKAGVEHVHADIVLFLDADLIGLTAAHVRALIQPVMAGEHEATVGIFEGGRPTTDWAQALAPFLSGQRAMRRELIDDVENLDEARFGVELQIHRQLKRLGKVPKEVILSDVSQVMKEEKMGLVKGLAARMKMYWEIIREIPRI